MKTLISGVVIVAIAGVMSIGLSGEVVAQVAAVNVKAEANGNEAVVQVAVNAKFKEPTGDLVSGDNTFADVKVAKGATVAPDPVTRNGFRYSIEVQWKDDNTIEARAVVRSLYGTAKGVGSFKL